MNGHPANDTIQRAHDLGRAEAHLSLALTYLLRTGLTASTAACQDLLVDVAEFAKIAEQRARHLAEANAEANARD